jgi:hypothetical protein
MLFGPGDATVNGEQITTKEICAFGDEGLMAGRVLRLEVQDADEFAGSVGFADSEASLAFEGWISFMAAIDQLLRPASECGGEAP